MRVVQFADQVIQVQTQLALFADGFSELHAEEVVHQQRGLQSALQDGVHVAGVADVLVPNYLSLLQTQSVGLAAFFLGRFLELFLRGRGGRGAGGRVGFLRGPAQQFGGGGRGSGVLQFIHLVTGSFEIGTARPGWCGHRLGHVHLIVLLDLFFPPL